MFGIGDNVKVPALVFASWCGTDPSERVGASVVAEGNGVIYVANAAGETAAVAPEHCTPASTRRPRGRRTAPAAPDHEASDGEVNGVVEPSLPAAGLSGADACDESSSNEADANEADGNEADGNESVPPPWQFRELIHRHRDEWWPGEDHLRAMATTFCGDVPRFLNALAASISLSVKEKNRILDSMPKLREAQVNELLDIFDDEVEKFETLYAECRDARPMTCAELEMLQRKHAAEWIGEVARRWRG